LRVQSVRRTWKIAAASALATLVVVATALFIAIKHLPQFRAPAAIAPEPENKDTVSLRRVMLDERDQAAARGDLTRVAMINAALSSEAQRRAAAVLEAWMKQRDRTTLLFAEAPDKPLWNYRNTGADCFGFLIQSAIALEPASMPPLKQTLEAETKLAPAGQLCQVVDAHTKQPIEETHEQQIFGASEYVKDGLLSVFEHYGADPVGPRMIAVLDTVLARSAHASKFGPLPGGGSEENGNILQACSRLSFTLSRDDYAEMVAHITDAAVTQMLPLNNGLPAMRFDYTKNEVVRAKVKLRDHGSEITPGLAEAFALAVARSDDPKWKERADRWAEPIAKMYETMLVRGRDNRGLLIGSFDPQTFAVIDPAATDNWGYLLNGVLLFSGAERKHGKLPAARLDDFEAKCDAVIDAVTQQYGADWEWGQMDGYADTLESAIYMAAHRPSRSLPLSNWIDDQIGIMFARQQNNGLVTGGYLDGNFIRTALLYAEQKSGGFRVEPWRSDVRVGFAREENDIVLVIMTTQPYTGTLHADRLRHREVMKLPWDWPRHTSWPQWFDPGESTRLTAAEGLPHVPSASQLARGIPLTLPANALVTIHLKP
jgi:hypothetical protein